MEKEDHFIFGIHAVQEAVSAGKDIDKVLVKRGEGSDLLRNLMGELNHRDIPIQQVPIEKLNRVTRKNHQGVIAWLSQITYHDITSLLPTIFESGEEPLIMILDGVSDAGILPRLADVPGGELALVAVGFEPAIFEH